MDETPIDIGFLGGTPFERARNLMARLRDPDEGCPWDIKQNFETIAPYTIEEAYEVSDAIAAGDMAALKDELGDLLLQVLFHSQMADEGGEFNVGDVCDGLTAKMVRRHPHVFGEASGRTSDEQTLAWEEIKAQERALQPKTETASLLDGVASALPELMRAEKLQKRAARAGFDWPDVDGVIDKIAEEAREVSEAAAAGNQNEIEDEIGDLLFAVTNIARHLKVDPEVALRKTNRKFTRRFQFLEREARKIGKALSDMSLEEMETLWVLAKTELTER